MYARGENVRDWLYVDDHCKAIDLVLRHGRTGEVYNIGGFNEQENIAIVRSIIGIVKELAIENPIYRAMMTTAPEKLDESIITYVADRPGHDMRYAIDSRKLQRELGWEPSLQFEEGIEKTVRWYLDNQDWMDNVTSGDYLKYYDSMYADR